MRAIGKLVAVINHKGLNMFAMHHIDGNPHNSAPENLVLVDVETRQPASQKQIRAHMKAMMDALRRAVGDAQ